MFCINYKCYDKIQMSKEIDINKTSTSKKNAKYFSLLVFFR